jgi:dihydrodipicolinate synthase/N-acetylneuraminate lyase
MSWEPRVYPWGSILLGHPIQFYPRSPEEIYRQYKLMCNSTNLAVNFYAGRLHVRSMHPGYFPLDTLQQIADIPNVVAMKLCGAASSVLWSSLSGL